MGLIDLFFFKQKEKEKGKNEKRKGKAIHKKCNDLSWCAGLAKHPYILHSSSPSPFRP